MKSVFVILLVLTVSTYCQSKFGEAIEDNSFFIEEAYNQEERVVQHISNGVYFSKPQKDIALSFTQEWPFFSQKHQLSFTLPYSILNSNSISGLNDILINYRYQLFFKDDWAAVSPRVSLVIPTGNYDDGFGSDVFGFQFAIPASKRINEQIVAHTNIGINYLPGVKSISSNLTEVKNNLTDYFAGVSIIWLTDTKFNVMLEYLFLNSGEPSESGIIRTSENIISPGIRGAIDVDDLQIVPGIAIPFSFSGSESRTGFFIYLSFEHPF